MDLIKYIHKHISGFSGKFYWLPVHKNYYGYRCFCRLFSFCPGFPCAVICHIYLFRFCASSAPGSHAIFPICHTAENISFHKVYGKILIHLRISLCQLMVDINIAHAICTKIHILQQLLQRIVIQDLYVISVCDGIVRCCKGIIYHDQPWQLYLASLYMDKQALFLIRKFRKPDLCPFSCRRMLHTDNIIFMDRCSNICRLSINGDNSGFSHFSSDYALFPIDSKLKCLSSSREQSVIWKSCLHGRICHCQPVVIINLHLAVIKAYKNKVIVLLIKIQADSDRRYKQTVLGSILFKNDLLHHFFTPECHTFRNNIQISCNSFCITRKLTASSNYKYCTYAFSTIQLFDLICHLSGHIFHNRRCH